MALRPLSFKRVVLGLQASAPDRTMQLAVELADLLHAELLGLFLEDTGLRNLAGIPFAREFRSLGGGWHPIDVDRLSHDLELSARSAERTFTEAAKRLPIRCQFEVIREATAETIASISRSGDIVMIATPVSPAERATQQYSRLIEAAFQSTAAVMIVPPNVVRSGGPVVAIAAAPDDPGIYAAAAIAIAANEDLVIVHTSAGRIDDPRLRDLSAESGLTIKHVVAGRALLSDPAAFSSQFHEFRERLVVITAALPSPDLL